MADQQLGSPGQGKRRRTPADKWLLGIGVLVIAFFVIAAVVNGFGDDTDESGNREARSACEQFVEARLKSPSTADFSEAATTTSGENVIVKGLVDSQNSFGGTVRNEYACTVSDSGGGNWKLVKMDLTSN